MKDTVLEFDLQRFADEAQPEHQDATQANEGQDQELDFDFAIDADGNVVFRDEEAEAPGGEQPQTPQTYKVKVDGQELEVPLDELLNGYQRQADYSRKTQEVAAMRRQYEEQMAALNNPQQPQANQQPQPNQPQPVQPQTVDPKEYYTQLANYAKGKVEQIFGTYDELDPMHQAALADEIANVKVQVVQNQQAQYALGNVMSKYQSDPEWQAIDRYAFERLNNMPYAQAVQVKAKLDAMDIGFIDQYLNAVRTEFYASKNPQTNPVNQAAPKPSAKPPFVESGGTAQETEKSQLKVDYKQLGKMTVDQQAEVFRRLGLTNL